MLKTINFKDVGHIESSLAILNMEIENSKKEGISILKLIHGYGSSGQGGFTLKAIRKELSYLKRQGKIKNYFNGDKWNLFENETLEILNKDKTIVMDEDLNKNNPGITIVVI